MPSQLVQKIRAKYPTEYNDMSDDELEKAILVKYPEYKDLATPQEGILDKVKKAADWALTPLLPSNEDQSWTSNKVYHLPLVGAVSIPTMHEVYRDAIRPLSAPIGLLAAGMEGIIGKNYLGGKQPAEVAPEATNRGNYLPLPRGKSAPIGKGFVHGQEGIAENRPYIIDTTAVNKGSGTVLPREAGEVTQVPPEIAATYGTGLGKPARAPLEDRYTGYSPVKQLTGMPEQNQLNPASGFNALGKDIIPQVDPLDISNPPQPESFKQQPYDINAHAQSLIDANQKGVGNEPPTSDLGSMLKEFEPNSAEQPALNRNNPETSGYTSRILDKISNGKPGLSDEISKSNIPSIGEIRNIVYRDPSGEPIAVANVVTDSNGKLKVMDMAANKDKGLLYGKAVKQIGLKLKEIGADTPAGTVTPDAQNLIEKGVNSKYDINAHIQQLTDEIKNKNQPISNQEAIPEFGSKLQEFFKSEEGALKLDPEVIQNVKEKITNAIRSSQRIILPDIFNRVKDQVTRKQFDRIIDQMLSSNEVNSQVSNKQVPINPTTDYVRNPTEAIGKLTNALREAAPLREQQEQLYTSERGKRLVAFQFVKTPGLAGIYQRMNTLKGELPKIDYAGLKLNKVDVDDLADAITNSQKITGWEKANAYTGLLKILTGSGVPQRSEIALLSRVFPSMQSEFAQMLSGPGKPTREVFTALGDLDSSSKTMMSAFDASMPLRQGGGLVHTKAWWDSFANMWKTINSDKIAYKATMDSIEKRPKYLLGRGAGLSLTNSSDILTREENFPIQGMVNKIPGVGASERMTYAFTNKLRADVFDRWTDMAKDAGLDLGTAEEPTKLTKDIAKVINNLTMRGSLNARDILGMKSANPGEGSFGNFEKIAPELNHAFYSPRAIASRLTMLNPYYYTTLEPFARQRALRAVMATIASDALRKGLYAAMGAKIGTDILSSDFMKSKFDNTRIDDLTGFQNYIVALARFYKGETDSPIKSGPLARTRWDIAGNFGVGKAAPIANLAATLAMGTKDKEGNLTRYGKPINIPSEVAQKFIPMFTQDMYDLYKNDPDLFPLGEAHFNGKLVAIPESFLGGTVSTYDNKSNKPVSRFRLR